MKYFPSSRHQVRWPYADQSEMMADLMRYDLAAVAETVGDPQHTADGEAGLELTTVGVARVVG